MVKKFRLDNGITVLLEPVEGVVSISAGLWVKTGSRDEKKEQYGYAHFVEHMLFKGTTTSSAADIARIVDRVGGQHNAATNREYTCYYINVISEHIGMAVELLADMYYNSVFDSVELGKEKNVIIEEIRMYEDTPDEFIHDLFMECMMEGHPLSHSILGTIESMEATTRDSLVSFYDKQYGSENVIFVISGNFDINAAEMLLARCFEKPRIYSGGIIMPGAVPARVLRKHVPRELEQVHFCMGTEGISRSDDDRWAMYLFSTILGGSMSSRLFQNIREKEGISYSIYSFHSSYRDHGVFGIYCATSPETYRRAIDLIMRECRDLVEKGISEEELSDAKTFMKGNLALSLESTEVRMGQLAKNEIIFGRSFCFEDILQYINNISLDDFQKISQKLFRDKILSLVSVGEIEEPDVAGEDLRL
ncbi:MAG TPA: pitrilysin family protein [Spirochaetota bacterium]|nr:pitrilysin family protein [Spirochaetota bacterium]HPI89741.1 pitrilysin family protein [Spirochaetota bacterium]HPR46626.1 pitrilysin family protein [Spirochaetota bacterium]